MQQHNAVSTGLRIVLFLVLTGLFMAVVQGSAPSLARASSPSKESFNRFSGEQTHQPQLHLTDAQQFSSADGSLLQTEGNAGSDASLATGNDVNDDLLTAQKNQQSLTMVASGMTLSFGEIEEYADRTIVQEVTVIPPLSWHSQPVTQRIRIEVTAADVTTNDALVLPDLLIGGNVHSRVTGLRGVLGRTADGLTIDLLSAQLQLGLAQNQAAIPLNGALLDPAGNFSAALVTLDTSLAGVGLTLNQIRVTNDAILAQDGYLTLPERLGSWRSDRIQGMVINGEGLQLNAGNPIAFTGITMALGSTRGYPMRSVSATVYPDVRERLYAMRLEGEVLVSIPGDATIVDGWMDLYENGVIASYVNKKQLPEKLAGLKLELEDAQVSADGAMIQAKSAKLTAPDSAGGLSITLNNIVFRAPGKDGCPQRPIGCLSISGGAFKLPELDLGKLKISFEGGLVEEEDEYIISGGGSIKLGELKAEGTNQKGLPCTGISVSGEIAASRDTERMIISLNQDSRMSQTVAYGPAVSPDASAEEQMIDGGVSLRKGALSLDCKISIPKTAHAISSISGSIELNSGMVSAADVEHQRRRDVANVWMQSWSQPTAVQAAAAGQQSETNQTSGCAGNQFSANYRVELRNPNSPTRPIVHPGSACESALDGLNYGIWNNRFFDLGNQRDGSLTARWEGDFTLLPGDYTFQLNTAPGTNAALSVNNVSIQNNQKIFLPLGQHKIVVSYNKPASITQSPSLTLKWIRQPRPLTCPKNQFLAQYYNNKDLGGTPVSSRCEPEIRYDWEFASPIPGVVNENDFSVRWTGQFDNLYGKYQFIANIDEGIRVYAGSNSKPIIDSWKHQGLTEHRGMVTFPEPGRVYEIRVEYFEGGGAASASVRWRPMTTSVKLNLSLGIVSDVEIPLAGPVIVGTGTGSLGVNPFELGIDLSAKLFNVLDLERRYFRIYEEPTWGLKGGISVNRPYNIGPIPILIKMEGELNAWLEPSTLVCLPVFDPATGGVTQTICFEKRTLLDRFFLTLRAEFNSAMRRGEVLTIWPGTYLNLPPVDLPGIVGVAEGGRFTSRLWGAKAFVDWYRSTPRWLHWALDWAAGFPWFVRLGQTGVYVDQTGTFRFATDLSQYKLATPPRVAAARELWRQQQAGTLAANATGPEYIFTDSGDVEITIGDKFDRVGRVNIQATLTPTLTSGDVYGRLQLVTPEGEVVTAENAANFAGRVDYLNDQSIPVPVTDTITATTRIEMFAIRLVQSGENWSVRFSPRDIQDYDLSMSLVPAIPTIERFTVEAQEGEATPTAVVGWQITGTMPVSVTIHATIQDYVEETPSTYLQDPSASGDTSSQFVVSNVTVTTRTLELGDFLAMADGNYMTATVSLENFETGVYNFYIDVATAGAFDQVVTATSEDIVWVSQDQTWPLFWTPEITPTVAFKTLELEWETLEHPEVSGYVVYLSDQPGLANPLNALYEFDNGNANKIVYGGLRANQVYYLAVGVYRLNRTTPLLLSPEIAVEIPVAPYSITVDSSFLTVPAGAEVRTQVTIKTDLATYPEAVAWYSGCFGPQSFGSRYLFLPLIAGGEAPGVPTGGRLCEPADGFQIDLGRDQITTPYVVPTQAGVTLTLDVIVPSTVKPGRYLLPVDTWGGGQNVFFVLQVDVTAGVSTAQQPPN
jgi:hypothetical protein